MFLHRFTKILVVLTFGLLLLGGIVHNTGSSLACPDWPTCYGSFMPEMKGGVAIEHSHRLFAATIGLMTIVLAILCWKKMKWLGLSALFLVVFQGILGGVTVLYRLPAFVSTAHLATSFIFFALLITIASKTSPLRSSGKGFDMGSAERAGVRGTWVLLATILVYLQSLLGAIVRHTESGLVCPDIPFCYGSLWPMDAHPSLLLHMAHRWMGVLVACAILPLPIILRKQTNPSIRFLSWLTPTLVLVQITLGLLSVWTHLGIHAVTAHLGGAALLWGTMVALSLKTPLPTREREFATSEITVGEGSLVRSL